MAGGGSRKVVLLALGANLGIGVTKLAASLVTGSGSMMAEAIHSFADSGNQGLLLLGGARAAKPPNERHPMGYGREAYFWAFVVAVVLFTMGGMFSVYEGIHKLLDPHEIEHAGWALGVLSVALVLEGVSLAAALRMANAARGSSSLLDWARRTGDVDLLVVTYEDLAAQGGLVVAFVAVALAAATGDTRWDAAGSICVGLLLLVVAVFLGAQMRRLIVGSAADPAAHETIRAVWREHGFDVLRAVVVWVGPGRLSVALKVVPHDRNLPAAELIGRLNAAERAVRGRVPEVAWQFVEPDLEP